MPAFYDRQRERYRQAFESVGLEIFSGEGGFYHWCRLPGELSVVAFNQQLFKSGAAILQGGDCDMARLGPDSPLRQFFRFSFGPLAAESFEEDLNIMKSTLRSLI